jgi:hypothetical protein
VRFGDRILNRRSTALSISVIICLTLIALTIWMLRPARHHAVYSTLDSAPLFPQVFQNCSKVKGPVILAESRHRVLRSSVVYLSGSATDDEFIEIARCIGLVWNGDHSARNLKGNLEADGFANIGISLAFSSQAHYVSGSTAVGRVQLYHENGQFTLIIHRDRR